MGSVGGDAGHRKRRTEARSSSRPQKRLTTSVPAAETASGKEESRAVLRRLLSSYDALTGSAENPEAAKDAYQQLLATASDTCCAGRRIAARLLAKQGGAFVSKLDTTISTLIKLSAQQPKASEPAAVEEAARRDALQGLGRLSAAVAQQRADHVLTSAVEHLLRLSQRVHDGSKRAVAEAATNMDSEAAWTAPPTSEAVCVLAALEAAFRASPQVVLSTCLNALKKGHGELCGGARHMLTRNLLSARGQQAAGAQAAGQGCLAARVLAPRADVQAWLRAAIESFKSQGVTGKRAPEVAVILDRLSELVAPSGTVGDASPTLSFGSEPALPDSRPPPLPAASPMLSPDPPPLAVPGPAAMALPSGGAADQPVKLERLPPLPLASPNNMDLSGRHVQRGLSTRSGREWSPLPPLPSSERAAVPVPELELPAPGGDICAAASTLWLSGLPLRLTEAALAAECAQFGVVERVVLLSGSRQGEAYVAFPDIREAALCYEALCGRSVFGSIPLKLRFCEQPLSPLPAHSRWQPQEQLHVWVGGVQTEGGRVEVLRTLEAAGVQRPNMLAVSGVSPGLLLRFASPLLILPALVALRARIGDPARVVASAAAPAVPALPAPPRAPPRVPVVDTGPRTLWVGQVGPEIVEEQLLSAFRRFGTLTGWSFLRRSNCAFIDFQSGAAAAAARDALNGASFGPYQIRIEFKEELHGMGRHHMPFVRR